MTDQVKALLESGILPASRFEPTSRYAGSPVRSHDPGDGSPPLRWVGRRLVPPPEEFAELESATVVEGDRKDNLADRHLGDAAMWWLLADANAAVDPRELCAQPGRSLRITGPRGSAGEEATT